VLNSPEVALIKIMNFIQDSGNTNIMTLGTPHRHDPVEYSFLNKAIQSKYEQNKAAKIFVSIMECNYEYNRQYFIKHSMHFNRRAKSLVSKQLTS
jgi:hypothetical protein